VIDNPLIAEQHQTCYGCPDQWEGRLLSGEFFYFRYRSGWASLAVGHDADAVSGRQDVGMGHGDGLQGIFESAEARTAVFNKLLFELLAKESR
jgi:hypothetical protein